MLDEILMWIGLSLMGTGVLAFIGIFLTGLREQRKWETGQFQLLEDYLRRKEQGGDE